MVIAVWNQGGRENYACMEPRQWCMGTRTVVGTSFPLCMEMFLSAATAAVMTSMSSNARRGANFSRAPSSTSLLWLASCEHVGVWGCEHVGVWNMWVCEHVGVWNMRV